LFRSWGLLGYTYAITARPRHHFGNCQKNALFQYIRLFRNLYSNRLSVRGKMGHREADWLMRWFSLGSAGSRTSNSEHLLNSNKHQVLHSGNGPVKISSIFLALSETPERINGTALLFFHFRFVSFGDSKFQTESTQAPQSSLFFIRNY
jgi:hypothetical protein